MSKFVCDFAEVKSIGAKFKELGEAISDSSDGYLTNVKSDLSGWKSNASASFESVNGVQVQTTKADAEYATKLGEYLEQAADAIEKCDQEAASQIKI